jgi:hypothetical protein
MYVSKYYRVDVIVGKLVMSGGMRNSSFDLRYFWKNIIRPYTSPQYFPYPLVMIHANLKSISLSRLPMTLCPSRA